ncbi:metallophosphoesterase [Pseudomonas sp. CDFA 602]|uniref:metallophosphoesterase family protein n=1 Tax=Pseudomonas californiensis TaxID=2829823 RepID=UPI001E30AEA3|nr:metallophosphoesterase [Pseudomonas californiensis]MCD5997517.1 metallophosphoesterase [Pseudomonas californiensis]MCD6003124.1 metallophosphoesterase [Pseudomonas californiensis]
MTSNNKFNWLHISDFHQGMNGSENLWADVKPSFYSDIKYHCVANGDLHVVVFSGDLTQKADKNEFDAIFKEITALWDQFKTIGQNPSLFLIPGNHDLERPKPHSPVEMALKNWDQHIAEVFYDKKGPYVEQVAGMFKNYSQLLSKLKASKIPLIQDSVGALPGDSCGVWQQGEFRVGLLGMNTAWSQITGGDLKGKLELGLPQLHQIPEQNINEWTAANHANLIITHHPANWLSTASEELFNLEINPLGRFTAHLFGHMHQPVAVQEDYGDFEVKRSFQAASLFGLEQYRDHSERRHGYNFGRIDFDADEITWWPKRAEQRTGAGGWTIRPDTASLPKRQNEFATYRVILNLKKKN